MRFLLPLILLLTAYGCAHDSGRIPAGRGSRFHCDSDSAAYGYEFDVYKEKDGKWYYAKSESMQDPDIAGPFDSEKEAMSAAKKKCDRL